MLMKAPNSHRRKSVITFGILNITVCKGNLGKEYLTFHIYKEFKILFLNKNKINCLLQVYLVAPCNVKRTYT